MNSKPFDSQEYYIKNKVKINTYNRIYFKSYYENVIKKKLFRYKQDDSVKGVIIKTNQRVYF